MILLDKKQFEIIVKKIDALIKLTGLAVTKNMKFRGKVLTLRNVGIQPKEMAELLNTTPSTIRVA